MSGLTWQRAGAPLASPISSYHSRLPLASQRAQPLLWLYLVYILLVHGSVDEYGVPRLAAVVVF